MKLLGGEKWEKRITALEKRMAKVITPKSTAIFFTIIYLLSLVPLLWIAWYNYPSADDYSIGRTCYWMWEETHSLWRTVWQGMVRAGEDWINWMGYFTSNFLMAIPPNVFGERCYVLTTWMMLGILTASTMYLFHSIFVKALGANKYVSHSIAMIVLFTSVQCMCPEGRVEAFFWYSGAINYIFVHGMSLFFFGLLISAYYDKGKKRVWDLVMASVIGFLTGGGNQMTALNMAVVVLAAVIMISVFKKWKECKKIALPMAFSYLGFLLNIAAPGNWVRAERSSGMNPVRAVFVSFYQCIDRVIGDWTDWTVIVLLILLIPLFWYIAGNMRFQYRYPLLVIFGGFCLVSAMVTPPLFAVGSMEAGRIQALTYLMYILILSLCVGYITGWVRKRVVAREADSDTMPGFSASQIWCLIGCVLFLVFGSILSIIPEPHYFTFSSALVDLTNGNAKAYKEVLDSRVPIYRRGGEGIIEVEPLGEKPVLLYYSDIQEDPGYWENEGLKKYYKLDGVKVR